MKINEVILNEDLGSIPPLPELILMAVAAQTTVAALKVAFKSALATGKGLKKLNALRKRALGAGQRVANYAMGEALSRNKLAAQIRSKQENAFMKAALDALHHLVTNGGGRSSIGGYAFDIARAFNGINAKELAATYEKNFNEDTSKPLDIQRGEDESMDDFMKRLDIAKGVSQIQIGSVDPEIADWPYWNNRDGEVHGYNYPGHKLGDKSEVSRMQNFLKSQGYDIAVDGVLGDQTAAAIDQYLNKTRVPSEIEREYPDPETGVFPDELEYEPEPESEVDRLRRELSKTKQGVPSGSRRAARTVTKW